MMLFRGIELPSDEPVLYVGIHPIRWTERVEPTVGFVPIEDSEYATLSAKYAGAQEALQAIKDMVANRKPDLDVEALNMLLEHAAMTADFAEKGVNDDDSGEN